MKKLLELLGFCSHKWIQIEKLQLQRIVDNVGVGYEYVCRCEKCGKIKGFKV